MFNPRLEEFAKSVILEINQEPNSDEETQQRKKISAEKASDNVIRAIKILKRNLSLTKQVNKAGKDIEVPKTAKEIDTDLDKFMSTIIKKIKTLGRSFYDSELFDGLLIKLKETTKKIKETILPNLTQEEKSKLETAIDILDNNFETEVNTAIENKETSKPKPKAPNEIAVNSVSNSVFILRRIERIENEIKTLSENIDKDKVLNKDTSSKEKLLGKLINQKDRMKNVYLKALVFKSMRDYLREQDTSSTASWFNQILMKKVDPEDVKYVKELEKNVGDIFKNVVIEGEQPEEKIDTKTGLGWRRWLQALRENYKPKLKALKKLWALDQLAKVIKYKPNGEPETLEPIIGFKGEQGNDKEILKIAEEEIFGKQVFSKEEEIKGPDGKTLIDKETGKPIVKKLIDTELLDENGKPKIDILKEEEKWKKEKNKVDDFLKIILAPSLDLKKFKTLRDVSGKSLFGQKNKTQEEYDEEKIEEKKENRKPEEVFKLINDLIDNKSIPKEEVEERIINIFPKFIKKDVFSKEKELNQFAILKLKKVFKDFPQIEQILQQYPKLLSKFKVYMDIENKYSYKFAEDFSESLRKNENREILKEKLLSIIYPKKYIDKKTIEIEKLQGQKKEEEQKKLDEYKKIKHLYTAPLIIENNPIMRRIFTSPENKDLKEYAIETLKESRAEKLLSGNLENAKKLEKIRDWSLELEEEKERAKELERKSKIYKKEFREIDNSLKRYLIAEKEYNIYKEIHPEEEYQRTPAWSIMKAEGLKQLGFFGEGNRGRGLNLAKHLEKYSLIEKDKLDKLKNLEKEYSEKLEDQLKRDFEDTQEQVRKQLAYNDELILRLNREGTNLLNNLSERLSRKEITAPAAAMEGKIILKNLFDEDLPRNKTWTKEEILQGKKGPKPSFFSESSQNPSVVNELRMMINDSIEKIEYWRKILKELENEEKSSYLANKDLSKNIDKEMEKKLLNLSKTKEKLNSVISELESQAKELSFILSDFDDAKYILTGKTTGGREFSIKSPQGTYTLFGATRALRTDYKIEILKAYNKVIEGMYDRVFKRGKFLERELLKIKNNKSSTAQNLASRFVNIYIDHRAENPNAEDQKQLKKEPFVSYTLEQSIQKIENAIKENNEDLTKFSNNQKIDPLKQISLNTQQDYRLRDENFFISAKNNIEKYFNELRPLLNLAPNLMGKRISETAAGFLPLFSKSITEEEVQKEIKRAKSTIVDIKDSLEEIKKTGSEFSKVIEDKFLFAKTALGKTGEKMIKHLTLDITNKKIESLGYNDFMKLFSKIYDRLDIKGEELNPEKINIKMQKVLREEINKLRKIRKETEANRLEDILNLLDAKTIDKHLKKFAKTKSLTEIETPIKESSINIFIKDTLRLI